MDISSARLASLLKQAMTPQALPSAKADPARAALVKALLAPPVPTGVRPQQPAPVLSALLPAVPMAAPAQQLPSAQVMQAYLALTEPAASAPAMPAAVVPRQTESDDFGRAPPLAMAKTDDAGSARLPAMPWLAVIPQQSAAARHAASAEIVPGRPQRAVPPSGSPDGDSAERQLKIGLASLAVAALLAVAFGLALLVFG
jgi:hypothetical protein